MRAAIILVELRREQSGERMRMIGGVEAMWGSHWGDHMSGGWWGMGLSMGVFSLLLVGIGVAVVVAVVRGRSLGPSDESRGNSALRILEERYARGDISKQEFEEKKSDLRS